MKQMIQGKKNSGRYAVREFVLVPVEVEEDEVLITFEEAEKLRDDMEDNAEAWGNDSVFRIVEVKCVILKPGETFQGLPYIKTLLSILEEATDYEVEIHHSLEGEMFGIKVIDGVSLVAEAWRLPHELWRLKVEREIIGGGPCQ